MIIFILLLGLVLRVILINQSVWLDEATSVLVARDFSFQEIVTRFSSGDFHPPLYYFLLKTWGNIFGFSEIGTRSLSILAGVITIFVIYKICRILFKETSVSNNAALLLAVNPLHIYYSQEARMYSLATLLASMNIFTYLNLLHRKSIKSLILFSLSISFSLYTFYPLSFLILFIVIYSLISRKQIKITVMGVILGIVPFVAWIPVFINQVKSAASVRYDNPRWWNILGRTSFRQMALVWVKFLVGRISFYTKKGYITYVAVSSIFPLISLFKSWIRKKSLFLIWGWLLVPLLLFMFMGIVGAGFNYFRLLFILPAFCILLACGISSFSASSSRFVLFAILVSHLTAIIIFWINPRYHREDWRSAVGFIESNSNESSVSIIFNIGQSDPYRFYARKVPIYSAKNWEQNLSDHIWLIRYAQPIFDPDDNLRKSIEGSGFAKSRERDFNGVTIWEYKKNEEDRI